MRDAKFGTLICASLSGSLLSLLITGYSFPGPNNIFHLPIVGLLYELPQFKDDPFIQSLRHFAAGPWLTLRGSSSYIEPKLLFYILLWFSRFICFYGFLLCSTIAGVTTVKQHLLLVLIICCTFLLRGSSFAGDGGLFLDYFTQSELANGFFLIAVFLACKGSLSGALFLTGLTFFCNAFMGVWTGFVTCVVLSERAYSGQMLLESKSRIGIAAVATLGISSPVLMSIYGNPEFGKPLDFNYVEYLTSYYPYHFFFLSFGLAQKVGLGSVLIAGAVSLDLVGCKAKPLYFALAAATLIYIIGIAAPYWTTSHLVFNLHLLRSGVLIHMLAAVGVGTLVCIWIASSDIKKRTAATIILCTMAVPAVGPLRLLVALILGLVLISIALLPATKNYRLSGIQYIPLNQWLVLAFALLMLNVLIQFGSSNVESLERRAWRDEWDQVASWARNHTKEDAVFLIPQGSLARNKYDDKEDAAGLHSTIFEYKSRRKIWVDFKRGAAVMWSPSYYGVWQKRSQAVDELSTNGDRLAYAANNDISFVIATCNQPSAAPVVHQTRRLCVYSAR
jgi:hypothetical protein